MVRRTKLIAGASAALAAVATAVLLNRVPPAPVSAPQVIARPPVAPSPGELTGNVSSEEPKTIRHMAMASEPAPAPTPPRHYFGGDTFISSTKPDGEAVNYTVPVGFMALRGAVPQPCQGYATRFDPCQEGEYMITRCLKPVAGSSIAGNAYHMGPDETCEWERLALPLTPSP